MLLGSNIGVDCPPPTSCWLFCTVAKFRSTPGAWALLVGAATLRFASHLDQDDEAIRDIKDDGYALRLALGRELPGFSETFAGAREDFLEGRVPREEWNEMVYPLALRNGVP